MDPPLPISPSSPTTSTKKPSMLRTSLEFLKKKKKSTTVSTNQVQRNKKRLSLGHIITHHVHRSPSNDQEKERYTSSILNPPSPMFSPHDFYYSPAAIDKSN